MEEWLIKLDFTKWRFIGAIISIITCVALILFAYGFYLPTLNPQVLMDRMIIRLFGMEFRHNQFLILVYVIAIGTIIKTTLGFFKGLIANGLRLIFSLIVYCFLFIPFATIYFGFNIAGNVVGFELKLFWVFLILVLFNIFNFIIESYDLYLDKVDIGSNNAISEKEVPMVEVNMDHDIENHSKTYTNIKIENTKGLLAILEDKAIEIKIIGKFRALPKPNPIRSDDSIFYEFDSSRE